MSGYCYDQQQRNAAWLTWLCCRSTVYTTHPQVGCLACR